ncbi:hypothetical protein N452_00410 [Clostridium botulinum A2 117]|uniref:hypothetical protein n=1 Tax=Clostridium botulinum TaxID=1491 RepID=UPI0007E09A42|nr:hypothetical protein [Clostridium botulinum]KEI83061.1 hypothetical protein N452_00410 [Clostridium botulinum A2 117]MBN3417252.1 hypothetical protein [Clostridium botulinum]MBN3443664.1 hypothetical protein [Clostridium botulinum]MBY6807768.1 hypothetical protein [Clostridium botulinum]NFS09234.1 hypothetical protein [Clostridium botulinum]
MKVLIINKKRFGVTMIIIGLMLILFGLEKNFDNRLKIAALIHNNVSSFKEYNILNGKISYKLPSNWEINEEIINGEDIIYSNSFIDKKNNMKGFIQLWNYKGDLKAFIKHSKEVSDKQQVDYTKYNVVPVDFNNMKGYLAQYSILKENKEYVAYEYFFKVEEGFIRVSFFVPEKYYQESIETVFNTILKNIVYKH